MHVRYGVMVAAGLGLAACSSGVSGPVGSACVDSPRDAANPALCSCIQQVADQTLDGADQRRVATFFEDPERAQDIRASDTAFADAFWDRYLDFIRAARSSCG